jgi:hypothetical protein
MPISSHSNNAKKIPLVQPTEETAFQSGCLVHKKPNCSNVMHRMCTKAFSGLVNGILLVL